MGAGCFSPGDADVVLASNACESNAQCDEGQRCFDGNCRDACVDSTDCDNNEVCGDEGVCVARLGQSCSGADSCGEGFACVRGACARAVAAGETCRHDAECISGSCVGGICCNRACDAACESCANAETGVANGTCATALPDTDPEDRCGATAVCGAGGSCVSDNGVACTDNAQCGSGFCVDGVCCNSACDGICRSCLASESGGVDGQCTFVAAGDEIVLTDPSYEDCPGVQTCDGNGACFAKAAGESCGGDDECGSGFCTDGVCCGSRCGGTCEECNSGGACVDVTSGPDPGTCTSGCFADGTCDGKQIGEVCADPGECASGICAGGTCRLANGNVCANDNECEFTCVVGVCAAPSSSPNVACDSAADCRADLGLTCSGGVCKYGDGEACGSNLQCVNVCIGGTCGAVSAPAGACDSGESADCESGLICDGTTCVIPTGDNRTCTTDAQCQEPICLFGACSPLVPSGGQCESTDQCADRNNDICTDDTDGSSDPETCTNATGEPCSIAGCPGNRTCGERSLFGEDRCRQTDNEYNVTLRVGGVDPGVQVDATLTCRRASGATATVSQTSDGTAGPILCARGDVMLLQCVISATDSPSESGISTNIVRAEPVQLLANGGRVFHVLAHENREVPCIYRND